MIKELKNSIPPPPDTNGRGTPPPDVSGVGGEPIELFIEDVYRNYRSNGHSGSPAT
jgi:hypothetical protein